ncbi:sensor histidine kinase [Amycolatopsis anabasis]|uniref:sensor histidine kinase n=1 Tax=Amycolatopsis anabasis TaxID=1840409 RepID=UPI001C550E51|nr:sensor histidine kinase [Amycolatopsis anabasis]
MVAEVATFEHPALFYRDQDEYLAGTVPFVRSALRAGEPVAVAVPSENLAAITAALGEEASAVRLIDMTRAGRNPGRIIPGVLRAFADAHDGPVRIIGEPIWPGRSVVEYPACAQHEALINHAFAGRAATILCPYDAKALDGEILADAAATHPVLVDATGRRPSPAFAPDAVVATYNEPLAPPESSAVFPFTVTELQAARHFLTDRAGRLGLTGDRLDDLALAVAELCANSVVHGQGQGVLRVWSADGYVVSEVADRGFLADPLAGRLPAAPDQLGGRGLLMVNELVDLVRVHAHPGGTIIRVYLRC